jgi:hypothetical protein
VPRRLILLPNRSIAGPASRHPTKQPTDSRPAATLHCKKKVIVFPFPSRDVTNQTLPAAGNNLIIPGPGRVWLVTSRLGTGKIVTFFTVYMGQVILLMRLYLPLKRWMRTITELWMTFSRVLLELLTANATFAIARVQFNPRILRHSGISGGQIS